MKKFQFLCILTLLFGIFIGCHASNPQLFWLPNEENRPFLRMDYGNPLGDKSPGYNLTPEVESGDSRLCFHSRSPLVVDYGPRFSLCIPWIELEHTDRSRERLLWEGVIQSLVDMGSVRSFPQFQTRSKNGSIRFEFITEARFRNLWRARPPMRYLLGDLRLKRILGGEVDISLDGSLDQISRYYGTPYWNYMEGEECAFLFSTWDVNLPANQRRILKLGVDCDQSSPVFEKFFHNVQSVNRIERERCIESNLELTEVFSHAESDFGRFLEFRNPSEESNCRKELRIAHTHLRASHPNSSSGDSEGVRYSPGWDFLFPGAVVLLSPSDSKLESYPWEQDYLWTPLGQGNPGIEGVSISEWNRFSGFRFEEEYTSWRKEPYPCSLDDNEYRTTEKFCGSPGLHEKWTIDPGLYCSHRDIYLTEANFWGIQNSRGDLDSRDRFLEFYYSGGSESLPCDPSSLWLDWEAQIVPLSIPPNRSESRFLEPGEIFLVSLSPNLPTKVRRFPRNLFTLNPNRSIRLGSYGDSQDKSKLVFTSHRDFWAGSLTILPRDEKGALYSLVFPHSLGGINPTIIEHHPQEEFAFWSSRKNYMSPGRISQSISRSPSLSITEILWMGSYLEGQSVLSDRFLEWRNADGVIGSFYLGIDYPGVLSRRQLYLLPLSGEEYGYISSTNLRCFKSNAGIHSNSFRLFNESASFQLYSSDGSVLDTFFLNTSRYGLNNTRDRIRRSAVRSRLNEEWFTSIDSDSDCPGETYASPGSMNRDPEYRKPGSEEPGNGEEFE